MQSANKKNKPMISILSPIMNVEKYIGEMIESVLAQSFQDWELIVMDGSSKDKTVEIVKQYADKDSRIRLYSEPDECSWHAFDKTFDLANGDFICNLCGQDGFLDKDWLSKCAEIFNEQEDVSLVWALTQPVDEDGKILSGQGSPFYESLIQKGNAAKVVSNIVKKSRFIIRDLLFADWKRKKMLLENIFSRHAGFKINLLTQKKLRAGTVPQKKQWFYYWLDTGLQFLDQSMVVSKEVFLSCIPRYQLGSRTMGYMTDFYYNFNARGYLSYFVPTYAVFGRIHPGNSGERGGKELHQATKQYLDKVAALRSQIKEGSKQINFVDRNGVPVISQNIV